METKNDLSFYLVNKIYGKVEIQNLIQSNQEIYQTKSEEKCSFLHAFLNSSTSLKIKLLSLSLTFLFLS